MLDAGAGFGWLAASCVGLPGAATARARRVIQLFTVGGMSHVDTFDFKPELVRMDGKSFDMPTFFGQAGNLYASPWKFEPRGQSGLPVSDLLPNLARCADRLTLVKSVMAKSANHMPAIAQMNTGFILTGFPSMGAWVTYGLGTENRNLPSFVVLTDPNGAPWGGSVHWSNGFLPAGVQGTPFRPAGDPVPDLATPAAVTAAEREAGLAWLNRMNRRYAAAHPGDSALEARVRSYEMAASMQLEVPGIADLATEPEHTRKAYGLDQKETESFGRSCLLARRLVERGVRFVQAYHGGSGRSWDAHGDLEGNHSSMAKGYDQPAAALIEDLAARGLLDDTLVMGITEFGRTPVAQGAGKKGRDHHPDCFTVWLAGAGLKPGFAYGASDEVGRLPGENAVTVHDLHATALHLLGIDHEKLTYYHNGIRRRLTDVHGRVIQGLLA